MVTPRSESDLKISHPKFPPSSPIGALAAPVRLVVRIDQTLVLVRAGCDREGRPGIWIGREESDGIDALAVQVIVLPMLPEYRYLIRQPPVSPPRA